MLYSKILYFKTNFFTIHCHITKPLESIAMFLNIIIRQKQQVNTYNIYITVIYIDVLGLHTGETLSLCRLTGQS